MASAGDHESFGVLERLSRSLLTSLLPSALGLGIGDLLTQVRQSQPMGAGAWLSANQRPVSWVSSPSLHAYWAFLESLMDLERPVWNAHCALEERKVHLGANETHEDRLASPLLSPVSS